MHTMEYTIIPKCDPIGYTLIVDPVALTIQVDENNRHPKEQQIVQCLNDHLSGTLSSPVFYSLVLGWWADFLFYASFKYRMPVLNLCGATSFWVRGVTNYIEYKFCEWALTKFNPESIIHRGARFVNPFAKEIDLDFYESENFLGAFLECLDECNYATEDDPIYFDNFYKFVVNSPTEP